MILRALIVVAALVVASCGFQPLYAGPNGQPAIGPVQVSSIEGKAGHVLRAELNRILAVENNGGPSSRLEIRLAERVSRLGYRLDESSTRVELRLIANYVLTTPDNRRSRGSVTSVVNYDIPRAAFGEIAAQDDARERAAESLAPRLRSELAIRMSQLRNAPPPPPPPQTPPAPAG